ncbi:MAG: hypothetical protein M1828_005712 [Chrysothrix sp. TS-e1954]|nr:MAG: hypothetical protein M1828_005712 [Chrysothrix sp. TS-e1954]
MSSLSTRPVRVLAGGTFIALIYFLTLFLRQTPQITRPLVNTSGGAWKDPNAELINEPPEPLHRIHGDNYAADNPSSDRINATILSLVRNSELEPLIQSMRDLERTFNRRFNYPWTFFNDEPFSETFKAAVLKETSAKVNFELVPREHWEMPPWINHDLFMESARMLAEQEIQYADMMSYHQMCRWQSGVFPHHPALKDVNYYWRVEPNVHFFCEIDYDVFRFMQDHNKTYGFTVSLYDAPQTITSLWPETQRFLADPDNAKLVNENSAMAWLTDKKHRPSHNEQANGFSTCHFWSNFEIGSLEFWRSKPYQAYFDHLDRAGGFFYERWGDAPVHTIGLGLFEDKEKLHWFRDIGYQHIPFFNCPKRPPGKCKGCKTGMLTDGEKFLYKEDCRPSYFEHVGFGEWEQPSEL